VRLKNIIEQRWRNRLSISSQHPGHLSIQSQTVSSRANNGLIKNKTEPPLLMHTQLYYKSITRAQRLLIINLDPADHRINPIPTKRFEIEADLVQKLRTAML
jgi:hypothetical protein